MHFIAEITRLAAVVGIVAIFAGLIAGIFTTVVWIASRQRDPESRKERP